MDVFLNHDARLPHPPFFRREKSFADGAGIFVNDYSAGNRCLFEKSGKVQGGNYHVSVALNRMPPVTTQ